MFEQEYYEKLLPTLTKGFWLSLEIIVPSVVFGLVIGILVGAVRGTGYPRFLLKPLNAYVSLFRGTALVVQLVVCYYGLPDLAMLIKPFFVARDLPPVWKLLYLSSYASSVLVFSLCSGAYHSEYIRGAILSIKRGQFQAASALGFSKAQTFWSIVIPQAVRRAWPGCGNEIIYLVKYSSLAFVLAVMELTGASRSLADTYFRYTETYFVAGLYYLLVGTLLTWLFHRLEKAWAVPGFGQQ